jgi:hypothetical protein
MSQAETTYIAAVPSIVMELMIPNTWDENACDTFSGPSSQTNVVQFLDATKGESSLIVLRQVRNIRLQHLSQALITASNHLSRGDTRQYATLSDSPERRFI